MAFNFAKTFSGKSIFAKDSKKRMNIALPSAMFAGATGAGPAATATQLTFAGPLYDYRADETGTRSVKGAKEKKAGDIADLNAYAAGEAARQREDTAQAAARRAQADQLAARRRNKRFAYGYNRASQAGGLGGGGIEGGQKTLLGY